MSKAAARQKNRNRALMVIPTMGDRPDLLREALESVANQKPFAYDLILVSPRKDRIRELAREFNANVVKDPGKGLSAALNIGFASAKPWHEFGSWMGDDDLLRPGCLSATISVLDGRPDAVLAYGYCDYIDDKSRIIFTNRTGNLAPWIMRWGPNLLSLMGILYRLEAAHKAGGYDESLKNSMDLDMWLRLRKHGKFINTKRTLGAFRWHPSSITVGNRKATLKEAAAIKRKYLPRPLALISPLWELPVWVATMIAAYRVNALAKK